MAQAVDASVLALLKDVLAVAPRRGVRVTRAPDGTVTVSVYGPAPAQHTRRAAAAAKQSPEQLHRLARRGRSTAQAAEKRTALLREQGNPCPSHRLP